jgi:hypothetical protein
VAGTARLPAFFADPRTGRVTFTQFGVTETIPVRLNPVTSTIQTVYPLYLPGGSDSYFSNGQYDPANYTIGSGSSTFAPLVNIGGNSGPEVHPQLIPYSDSLRVRTFNGPQSVVERQFTRANGEMNVGNITTDPQANTAYTIAGGVYPEGAGTYSINYTADPALTGWNGVLTPYLPITGSYQLGDEVPLIEVPQGATDPSLAVYNPNTPQGTVLKLSYRFTFSTLDGSGTPMNRPVASYSSQRFLHLVLGFRQYDETSSQPHDYQLATSVGSTNPIDELPAAE